MSYPSIADSTCRHSQATVVTADGSILTASETENPDLFWGIRGAGSNLGIVTEFVLELYPQRATVYSGVAIYPLPFLQKLNALTDEWWKNGPSGKEAMLQALSRGPDGNVCSSSALVRVTLLIIRFSRSSPCFSSSTAARRKAERISSSSLTSVSDLILLSRTWELIRSAGPVMDLTREIPYEFLNTLQVRT